MKVSTGQVSLTAVVLAALASVAAPWQSVAVAQAPAYDFAPLDAFLEEALPRVGGLGVVVYQDGNLIYRRTLGEVRPLGRIGAETATLGPWTPSSVVPIASATKWWAAAVLMSVVDEGLLRLDDQAKTYLPQFEGAHGEMTIRQMFSHTSGLPWNPAADRGPARNLAEAADTIAEIPLLAPPGTHFHYGNNGMQAAGRIVEIVTGKSWAENFRSRIAEPLGLESTDFYAFGPTENPMVAGSVRTSLDEFGVFVRMIAAGGVHDGKRILSEAAVKEMLSNQHPDLPTSRQPYASLDFVKPGLAKIHYGIGVWLEEYDPVTGDGIVITSGGAFGASPFIDRRRGLAGVYLPFARSGKKNPDGKPYNDATRVYFEMEQVLDRIVPPRDE
jgi:CubicO group peptidase (beta-lactamase class C family)